MNEEIKKRIECNKYWMEQPYEELVRVYKSIQKAKKAGYVLMLSDHSEESIIQVMCRKIEIDNERWTAPKEVI